MDDRSDSPPASVGFFQRLESGWKLALEKGQRHRRAILFVAASAIIVALVLTIRAHPEILENLSWPIVLLLTIIATPLLVLLGAVEFVIMAAALRVSITLGRSFFVTVIATAANFLPAPGAMMTRIAALKAAGATAKRGAQLSLYFALLWVAMTMILGGGGVIAGGKPPLGAAILAAGLAMTAVAAGLVAALGAPAHTIAQLIFLRFLGVFLDGVRIAIALAAIGVDVPLYKAMIFTLASSFGSALSLVPMGLGIRELIAGLLSPLAGIPIALGFAGAVLMRLADLIVIFFLAIVLGLHEKKQLHGKR